MEDGKFACQGELFEAHGDWKIEDSFHMLNIFDYVNLLIERYTWLRLMNKQQRAKIYNILSKA